MCKKVFFKKYKCVGFLYILLWIAISKVTFKSNCKSIFFILSGLPKQKTKDGLDMTFATNHLGPFLLTNLLLGKTTQSLFNTAVISWIGNDDYINNCDCHDILNNLCFSFCLSSLATHVSVSFQTWWSVQLQHVLSASAPPITRWVKWTSPIFMARTLLITWIKSTTTLSCTISSVPLSLHAGYRGQVG